MPLTKRVREQSQKRGQAIAECKGREKSQPNTGPSRSPPSPCKSKVFGRSCPKTPLEGDLVAPPAPPSGDMRWFAERLCVGQEFEKPSGFETRSRSTGDSISDGKPSPHPRPGSGSDGRYFGGVLRAGCTKGSEILLERLRRQGCVHNSPSSIAPPSPSMTLPIAKRTRRLFPVLHASMRSGETPEYTTRRMTTRGSMNIRLYRMR